MFSDGLRDNLHDREASAAGKWCQVLKQLLTLWQVISIVDRALPPAQAALALD